MDTGYAKLSHIFNAPFGVNLPEAIRDKPFFGEFEYLVSLTKSKREKGKHSRAMIATGRRQDQLPLPPGLLRPRLREKNAHAYVQGGCKFLLREPQAHVSYESKSHIKPSAQPSFTFNTERHRHSTPWTSFPPIYCHSRRFPAKPAYVGWLTLPMSFWGNTSSST